MFSLNDKYPVGDTTIWYAKDMFRRGPVDITNLTNDYAAVGNIDEDDLDNIYMMMQGEMWSPRGEARELITSLGVDHTSMSVGDIIQVGNDFYMVAGVGFDKLN